MEVVQRESAWPGGWVLMSTIYAVRTGETERVLTGTVPAVKVKAGRMSPGMYLCSGVTVYAWCFVVFGGQTLVGCDDRSRTGEIKTDFNLKPGSRTPPGASWDTQKSSARVPVVSTCQEPVAARVGNGNVPGQPVAKACKACLRICRICGWRRMLGRKAEELGEMREHSFDNQASQVCQGAS